MKAWEKLLSLNNTIGYNREMVIEVFKMQGKCPAGVEAKYHVIGDKRLENFCKLGCGVDCMNEYLDLKVVTSKAAIK